ncbi:unnamed protein product [Withania somnifera]
MEYFLYIFRDMGHNLYRYSKSCLGCFNGSLYFLSFARSAGKEWTLRVLLIELRKQMVSISIAF